ncbi:hypothetical protein JTB14_020848, partial [Gonioctena quinquepunctata]
AREAIPYSHIANLNWGSDNRILINLYKSIVLSKLDYGAIVYASARISYLKLLEPIQASGLRLALGAFRTSPYLSLCCEAGVPPLDFRRKQLIANYAIKLWAIPDHPNHHHIFSEENHGIYGNRPTITRPATIRIGELMSELEEEPPETYNLGVYEVAPWEMKPPVIRFDCLKYKKDEAPRQLIHGEIRSILDGYPNVVTIYTDGSKTDRGVGSAFVLMNKFINGH